MRIWIDATQPECHLRVFNTTLLERHLRGLLQGERRLRELEQVLHKLHGLVQAELQLGRLAESRVRPTEIWIELLPGEPIPQSIPAELIRRLPIRWMREEGTVRERLRRAVTDAGEEPVLAFSANTIVDTRLIEHLAWWSGGSVAFIGADETGDGATMRLEGSLPESGDNEDDLLPIAIAAVESGALKRVQGDELEGYIDKLRRTIPPYVLRVTDDESRRRTERFLFQSNYKGSTDFLTKYVYPPLVRALLTPLTRWRVHPNVVTGVSIFAAFAAIPFFAAGQWVPALALAYLMSVLDSVDGKLARLTFSSSQQGDVLDHGLDIVHPPLWYWAWAWGLSGGDPFAPVFQASLWMAAFYILDRVMEMLFRSCTGQSIHGYRPLDARMRTVISRRNVNLAIFTVALLAGVGTPAFYGIVVWQGLSLLFHLARVIQFWNARDDKPLGGAAASAGAG